MTSQIGATSQDHIADRGHVSMLHYNVVDTDFHTESSEESSKHWSSQRLDKRRMNPTPASKTCGNCRLTQRYFLLVEQRIILLRQLKTSQFILDSSTRVASNIPHSRQISFSNVLTLKALSINGNRDLTLHPRVYESKDFVRVMASSRPFRDTEKAWWLNHTITSGAVESKFSNTCAKHIEDCKVGAEDWIARNFELSIDFTSVPPSETDSDDSECGALMHRNDVVPTCPKQVHRAQQNHGRMDHGLECRINHGKVIGKTMGGDTRKAYGIHHNTTIGDGYLNTKGSVTADRWTQLTPLVNITTRTTFTRSIFVRLICDCDFFTFQHEQRAGESFATSAGAKQKPVQCTAMIARRLDDKESQHGLSRSTSTRTQSWRPLQA